MGLSELVNITISRQTSAIAQAGFGVPLILGRTAAWSERIRTYTSLAGVAADFATSTAEYKAANAIFSQSPRPSSIKIGRAAAAAAVTQTITFAGDLVSGNVVNLNCNGVAVGPITFSSSHATTMGLIEAALEALPDVDTVTIGGTGNRVATVVGVAGYPIAITDVVVTLGASQTTATVATTTAGNSLVDDLSAIQIEDDTWYCIVPVTTTVADLLAVAYWTESQAKIALVQGVETAVLAATTTDAAAYLEARGYTRTAFIYAPSADSAEWRNAAWAGRFLPLDPGTETWGFKALAGITATEVTATQVANLESKNANVYRTIAGQDLTFDGRMASGEWIDVMRLIDFTSARIQEAIFALLVNLPKVPYAKAGVAAIEGATRAVLDPLTAQDGALGIVPGTVSVVAQPAADQTSANRAARIYPGLSYSYQVSGAIHALTVNGTVTV